MYKLTLHSHIHCHAAQANASPQACQRVYLSNRTTITTVNQAYEKEHRTDNSTYKKLAVQFSADTFVINQTLVLRINICGKNRHCRQAENRYKQFYENN